MVKFQTRRELSLYLYALLDATRRGWLEDAAISNFTRAMLVAGDIVKHHGGKNLRDATEETFKEWLAMAERAENIGQNRMVFSGDQYVISAKFVRTVDKLMDRVTDLDVRKSVEWTDRVVYEIA